MLKRYFKYYYILDDRWLEQFIDYDLSVLRTVPVFRLETGVGMTQLMLSRDAQHWRQIYYEQKEPDKTGIIYF